MNSKISTSTWSGIGGKVGGSSSHSDWEGSTKPPIQPSALSVQTTDTYTSSFETTTTTSPVNLTGTSTK